MVGVSGPDPRHNEVHSQLEELMKLNNLLFAAVLALFAFVATPAVAVTIFNDGFNDGTTCAWGPAGCTTLTLVDADAVSPVEGHEEWADYTVKFTVYAAGRDLWFEKEAARSPNPDLTKGFWFSIESGVGVTYGSGITPFSVSGSCPFPQPCTDTPTHFKVGANTVRTFWLNVRLDNVGGVIGTYRMRMTGLAYKFDGNNGDATTLITAIPSNFVTFSVPVGNQNTLGGLNAYEDFHQTTSQ